MSEERYVGIDVHKRHHVIAAVDAHQKQILNPVKVSTNQFENWAKKNLRKRECQEHCVNGRG